MHPNRNDPCPCGSGRKYKRCCAEADTRRERTLTLIGDDQPTRRTRDTIAPTARELLRRVPEGESWEVDALPLSGVAFDDTPDARPVALIVATHGLVLSADVVARPPNEPEDVGRLLAHAIETVARDTGRWPVVVNVRHQSVVAGVAAALGGATTVRATRSLRTIDDVAPGMQHALHGRPAPDGTREPMVFVDSPESWRAWDLPDSLLESLFAAAAAYYTAQPWTHLSNNETLNVVTAGGSRWTACVLGNAGEEFGLALYADRADYARLFEGEAGGAPTFHDIVLHLDYSRRHELPRPMQREFTSRGWKVAGPDAYPRLWAFNTPAGGVSRRLAEELAGTLAAIARFRGAHEAQWTSHRLPVGETWLDVATGFSIDYAGEEREPISLLWPFPERLSLGFAQGPGAGPRAAVDETERSTVRERDLSAFVAWLGTGEKGRRALSVSSVRKHAMNVRLFLDYVYDGMSISIAAVHEMDLRTFLYDWFPRKVSISTRAAVGALDSLTRFFRYLESARGIGCPWAAPLLSDRETFELRWKEFPGGFWWDAAVQSWRAELTLDLDDRVMLPSDDLGGVELWGKTMGGTEARLHQQLQHNWLVWRDESIAAGVVVPNELRRLLVQRQLAWQTTAEGGLSPRDLVLRERATTASRPSGGR